VLEKGENLRSATTTARYGVPLSSVQRALKSLDDKGVVREEETIGAIKYRLEDPFLGHWLRDAQAG
jgi:DNA-binding GntR family transcriptional regulator